MGWLRLRRRRGRDSVPSRRLVSGLTGARGGRGPNPPPETENLVRDYYAENAFRRKEFRPVINIGQRRAEGLGSAGKDFRVRV